MIRKLTRARLEKFLEAHQTSVRTLDIGAGGSSYQRFFPNRVTIDIDPTRKPDIVGDAENLPFKDGEFECILCTEVLEHIQNTARAVGEMRRVLKPGGTLILTTRFVYPIHDSPGDYWRFTKYGLSELFKEWNIVELTPEAHSFSTIAILLQRIAYQTRLRGNVVVKALLFALASLLNSLDFLVLKEYGDIKKTVPETAILSSGYYLVCTKP